MRRRDFLIGTSLAGLAGEAAAQPVPLGFRRALGPNGNAYGPITGGLNPTIDLNFINGATLDSRVTFTRASGNATYFDVSGVMQTASTNVARFDYDPVTHVLRGLLIEEARTNLAFPSADVSTLFTATATTMTAASGTAPDGANTMVRIAETATTAVHLAQKTATVTASATYTFSLFAKTAQDQYLQLFYDDTGSNGLYATFDLTGGTITGAVTARGTGTATGASIASVGNGIYRCTITGVATSATSVRYGVNLAITAAPAFAPSYAGNASNGLLVWGAQFELGVIPTTYIPTVGASVTRAADQAQVALSPPSAWTLGVEAMVPVFGGAAQGLGVIDDGTTNNRVPLRLNGTVISAAAAVAGVGTSAPTTANSNTVNTVIKAAEVSNGSAATQTAIANAGTAVTAAGAQPTGLTTLRLGQNAAGSGLLNGWIRRVRYYPQALSSAQLTQITT